MSAIGLSFALTAIASTRSRARLNALDFDYYVSPTGSDLTGDGSSQSPWATFKLVPQNSKVGMLPGTYDNVQYPNTHMRVFDIYSSFASLHGLFATVASEGFTFILNSGDNAINGIGTNVTTDETFLATYSSSLIEMPVMSIHPVEGKGSVIIKHNADSDRRDNPLVEASNCLFEDIVFEYVSSSAINYECALTRSSAKLGFKNCDFNITGSYSLTYVSEALFDTCTFVGGTRLGNYSGTEYVINTIFI